MDKYFGENRTETTGKNASSVFVCGVGHVLGSVSGSVRVHDTVCDRYLGMGIWRRVHVWTRNDRIGIGTDVVQLQP